MLAAMATVPRHRFVPEHSLELAYSDQPLSTAAGQTISQPYMVAVMTQLLEVRAGQRVLEIGTGSGYQTAVLAQLTAHVVSIERVRELAHRSRRVLMDLGYSDRVELHEGDGTLGWPDAAPYDRILVTAAAPQLPDALRHQLTDPGRIVIPIGDFDHQRLTVVDHRNGRWSCQTRTGCKFVPLIGHAAWPSERPAGAKSATSSTKPGSPRSSEG